ncbi:hypothetical protein AHF37_02853 [Paragonimus kellicotti]|nr:hypothetical protein AHF37_02853 [Paragonimus kellicotti]
MEALNQSTVLLKDELQNALSIALQRLRPDDTLKTDAILEEFNRCVSPSALDSNDVRREYIKRLCTRLVTLEAELRTLQSEYSQLKANVYLGGEQNELTDLKYTVDEINSLVGKLEQRLSRNEPPDTSSASKCSEEKVTINTLQVQLNGIRERLSSLQIAQPESVDQIKPAESISLTENVEQESAKSFEGNNSVEDKNTRQTQGCDDDNLERNKTVHDYCVTWCPSTLMVKNTADNSDSSRYVYLS